MAWVWWRKYFAIERERERGRKHYILELQIVGAHVRSIYEKDRETPSKSKERMCFVYNQNLRKPILYYKWLTRTHSQAHIQYSDSHHEFSRI